MNKKTIWITGGSTGIGKALAIKFANEGWNVAISARRENLLKEISEKYENIFSFPLDVTDKSKCKEVFGNIKDKFDNIDICFFSTGTWDPKKEKDIDVEQMEKVFKINFFGTVNSIKAVEKHFKEQIAISIDLKENVKDVEIAALQKSLKLSDFVKETRFVSKEEAAELAKEENGEDFMDFIGIQLDFKQNPHNPSDSSKVHELP